MRPILDRLRKDFDDFFLTEVEPCLLAGCRMLFFGWLFFWYIDFDFAHISENPTEVWRPILILRATGLTELPTADTLLILSGIWKMALLFSCVGLLFRVSTAISAGLGMYLLALTHSFGKINHSDGAIVLAISVLAFSKASDVLSLDRWAISKLRGRQSSFKPLSSGEYWWPIQMVRLLLVTVFFNAGVSKLINGGIAWVTSDHLYTLLLHARMVRDPILPVSLPYEWIEIPCKLLALATVCIEILAPLALFSRRAAMVIIPSLLSMQIGIRLVMGDDFSQFASLYVFWIPWPLVFVWVERLVVGLSREREGVA